MRTSETTKEVCAAMAAAQANMKMAHKDAANPFFKSKYSDMASIWNAASSALGEHNLFVVQDLVSEAGILQVSTRIIHSSGEWMEFGPLSLPVKELTPQGFGSASTYARRYALAASLGVVSDDDDGNAGTFINPDQQEVLKLIMGTDEGLKRWFWNLISTECKAKDLSYIPHVNYAALKARLEHEKKSRSVTPMTQTVQQSVPQARIA